jgi:predicted nuclease of predicted toxin-antitoxin system
MAVKKAHQTERLLLDEGLPNRRYFPALNRRHAVRHVHELKLSGRPDSVIYQRAAAEHRLIVTFNTKDYAKLLRAGLPTVIGLSMQLSSRQIDLKLSALLKRLRPRDRLGRVLKVSRNSQAAAVIGHP